MGQRLLALDGHRKMGYAVTKDGLDIQVLSFYFGCECGITAKINEDKFLGRDGIICSECGYIGTATMQWRREIVQL